MRHFNIVGGASLWTDEPVDGLPPKAVAEALADVIRRTGCPIIEDRIGICGAILSGGDTVGLTFGHHASKAAALPRTARGKPEAMAAFPHQDTFVAATSDGAVCVKVWSKPERRWSLHVSGCKTPRQLLEAVHAVRGAFEGILDVPVRQEAQVYVHNLEVEEEWLTGYEADPERLPDGARMERTVRCVAMALHFDDDMRPLSCKKRSAATSKCQCDNKVTVHVYPENGKACVWAKDSRYVPAAMALIREARADRGPGGSRDLFAELL